MSAITTSRLSESTDSLPELGLLLQLTESDAPLHKQTEAADRLLGNYTPPRSLRSAVPLYRRPSMNNDLNVFRDLVAYAPGMSSSPADVQAVLEAEAAPRFGSKRGTIDPAARTTPRTSVLTRSGGHPSLKIRSEPSTKAGCALNRPRLSFLLSMRGSPMPGSALGLSVGHTSACSLAISAGVRSRPSRIGATNRSAA